MQINDDSRHFTRLDAARGVAALAVAAFHCGQSSWGDGDLLNRAYDRGWSFAGLLNQLAIVLCNGHGAVNFFFVLSGFVLAISAQRSITAQSTGWWKTFLWRRVLRIYPAVIATTMLFAVLFWVFGCAPVGLRAEHFGLGEIFLNSLLIHTTINGVAWTLQTEMLAIPLILSALFLCRRNARAGLLLLMILLVGLHFSHAWRNVMGAQFTFVFGVWTAVYGRKIVQRTNRHAVWCSLAAMAMLFLSRPLIGTASLWCSVFESLVAACWIGCVAYGPATSLWGWLDAKPLQFMGRVSYSFYLLHPLCLMVFWRAEETLNLARDIGIPSAVVVLLLTVVSGLMIYPIARLFWSTIERPFMRMGRVLAPRREQLLAH